MIMPKPVMLQHNSWQEQMSKQSIPPISFETLQLSSFGDKPAQQFQLP